MNTQNAAFQSAQLSAKAVRDKVLAAIRSFGADGLTADECSTLIDIDRLTVRPRTSELFGEGAIRDSGTRRRNASGRRAIVWVVE